MSPPQIPNTKGWRAPWRRTWGGFGDGRSRLSRLQSRIRRELLEVYEIETAYDRRRLDLAARYLALAEKTLDTLDTDTKSTRRSATALQKVADMQLAGLKRALPVTEPDSFAARVRGS